jgi:hypothetical protein
MSDVKIVYDIDDRAYRDFLNLLEKVGKEAGMTDDQVNALALDVKSMGTAFRSAGTASEAALKGIDAAAAKAEQGIEEVGSAAKGAGAAVGKAGQQGADGLEKVAAATQTASAQVGIFSAIAGKIGPLLAVSFSVDAIAGFVSGIIDTEKQVNGLQKAIARFAGQTGAALDATTAKVLALSQTFGKDMNEVLVATNAFSQQTGRSFNDALTLIEKGFIAGADANGEFLDMIKEYPIQFKNAGFSAEEFIKITTQSVRGGIYSDKLLDTIKELDLSLKELTKTQIDALAPLGAAFSANLEKGLRSGTISTKEAFLQIAAQAQKVGLDLQQTQVIVADVFKGAGEDAGGFAEVLKQVNAALALNLDAFDELGAAQAAQNAKNVEYNAELVRLANNIEGANSSAMGFFMTLKTLGVSALNAVIEKLGEAGFLGKGFFDQRAAKEYASKTLPELQAELAKTEEHLARIGRLQRAEIQTLDPEQLQEQLNKTLEKREQLLRAISNIDVAKQSDAQAKAAAEAAQTSEKMRATEEAREAAAKRMLEIKKQEAAALASALESLRKQAAEAALAQEISEAGGVDSEGGLETIRRQELEKLRVQKAFALLNGQERLVLETKINTDIDQRLLSLAKKQADEEAQLAREKREAGYALARQAGEKELLLADQQFLKALRLNRAGKAGELKIQDEYFAQRYAAQKAALEKEIALRKAAGDDVLEQERQLAALELEQFKSSEEKKAQIVASSAAQRKSVQDALTDLSLQSIAAIEQFQAQASDREVARIEAQKNYELSLAGDSATARAAIEDRAARQVAAVRRKQAVAAKAAALFEIAVQTGINAVKVFAETVPPGILSAVAVGQGAIQAALVAAKPIPAYRDGTNFVQGPGTSTSDSILARLSVGEAVVPAHINREIMHFPHAQLPEAVAAYEKKSKNSSDKAPVSIVINADEKGIASYMNIQSSRVKRLDNRYKIN